MGLIEGWRLKNCARGLWTLFYKIKANSQIGVLTFIYTQTENRYYKPVTNKVPSDQFVRLLVGFFLLLVLYVVSTFNYLLFHGFVEFFSILVASGTFVVAWNARRFLQNQYFLVVGVAYLCVALLDLMHLMSYKGMAIIAGIGANEPTQLWIALRYMQSLSLVAAPFFIRRRLHVGYVLIGYLAATAAILAAIFVWPIFPTCFVEGQGLTFFKKASEYIVCGLLLGSIGLLVKERKSFEPTVLQLLIGSIGIAAASGIFFTFYSTVTDYANLAGHFVIVVSFYLMYKAVILTSFLRPYDLLFRELKASEASLMMAQEELERRVQERTGELAEATEALRNEVAERVASQEALRVERNRLKHIMESMEVGLCIVNHDYQIEYTNPTLERELGVINGRRCYEYFNALDAPCEWCKRHSIESGSSVRWEWQSPLSGKTYDLFDMPISNSDGSVSKMKIIQDITEQHRVRQALRESEERYRRIVETAAEGIWVLDAEDRTAFVNQRMATILGYTAHEMLDRLFFDLIDVEDRAMAGTRLERHRSGTIERHDFKFVRKDGENVWCLVSINPIFSEDNGYAGALIMATDLTERMRLEGQLRESQKMEAVGTLAGGIAHDFNNILAAIIGFTEMALDQCDDTDPKKRKLAQVLKAGIRGRELVKQILTFSRRSEQQPRPVRVAPLVAEATRLLKASLPHNVEIDQRIEKHGNIILADPTQIHQVLMNLCSNAIDAMRDSGGLLTIVVGEQNFVAGDATPHPGIEPGSHVRLSVSDTGTGMSREVRERIFEPFFSTKPSGQGTGLGLSVTYGIVKRYRGIICVTSEPGKGSIFEIFFPAIRPAEHEDPLFSVPALGGSECILLIDDDSQLLEMSKGILRGLGYKVVASKSGRTALKIFAGAPESFDLIILDQMMPKMSGIEVSRKIKDTRGDIPIILCTGSDTGIPEDEMRQSGISEIARKPLMKHEIAATIRRVLEKR